MIFSNKNGIGKECDVIDGAWLEAAGRYMEDSNMCIRYHVWHGEEKVGTVDLMGVNETATMMTATTVPRVLTSNIKYEFRFVPDDRDEFPSWDYRMWVETPIVLWRFMNQLMGGENVV